MSYSKLKVTFFILMIIWLLSSLFVNLYKTSDSISLSDNVVLFKIDKPLSTFDGYDVISSDWLVSNLDYYSKMSNVKVILLEINSPGGSAVASKEIVDEIKKIKNNVTVISYIRDIGTSGAYWIASSSDLIFANELSMVGSIGVISSYLDFSGLLRRYNVSYERLVAGKYKDMGSPFRPLSDVEKSMLNRQLNIVYEIFKRDVASNRNMTYDEINKYADGKVYLGIEAKKIGFVDMLGSKLDVLNYIKDNLNITPNIYNVETTKKFDFFTSYLKKLSSDVSYDSLYSKKINLN